MVATQTFIGVTGCHWEIVTVKKFWERGGADECAMLRIPYVTCKERKLW